MMCQSPRNTYMHSGLRARPCPIRAHSVRFLRLRFRFRSAASSATVCPFPPFSGCTVAAAFSTACRRTFSGTLFQ